MSKKTTDSDSADTFKVVSPLRRAITASITILGSFVGGALVVSIAAVLLGFWPQTAPANPRIVTPSTTQSPAPQTTTGPAEATPGSGEETKTPATNDPNHTEIVGNNTLVGVSEKGRGEACRAVVDAFADGQATAGQMTTAAGLTDDPDLSGLIGKIAARLKSGAFDGTEVSKTLDYCNSLGIAF